MQLLNLVEKFHAVVSSVEDKGGRIVGQSGTAVLYSFKRDVIGSCVSVRYAGMYPVKDRHGLSSAFGQPYNARHMVSLHQLLVGRRCTPDRSKVLKFLSVYLGNVATIDTEYQPLLWHDPGNEMPVVLFPTFRELLRKMSGKTFYSFLQAALPGQGMCDFAQHGASGGQHSKHHLGKEAPVRNASGGKDLY